MAELKFEITKNIGVLSESARGWTKELNMVSWNEREPKYDLREWNPDHTRMGKGITLTDIIAITRNAEPLLVSSPRSRSASEN